jgi:hypothetical protein
VGDAPHLTFGETLSNFPHGPRRTSLPGLSEIWGTRLGRLGPRPSRGHQPPGWCLGSWLCRRVATSKHGACARSSQAGKQGGHSPPASRTRSIARGTAHGALGVETWTVKLAEAFGFILAERLLHPASVTSRIKRGAAGARRCILRQTASHVPLPWANKKPFLVTASICIVDMTTYAWHDTILDVDDRPTVPKPLRSPRCLSCLCSVAQTQPWPPSGCHSITMSALGTHASSDRNPCAYCHLEDADLYRHPDLGH